MSNTSTVSSVKKLHFWDKWGIYFSGTCAIHCVLTPVFLIFYPAFTLFFTSNEELFHTLMALFVVPSFLFVIYSYLKIHKQKKPMIFVGSGFLLILFSTFFAHDFLGHASEPVLSILGSVLMIRGHFLNHNHCKVCTEKGSCVGKKNL